MLFATATIALVAALLPATLAAPLQKRVIGATIKSGRTGECLSLRRATSLSDGEVLTTLPCGEATRWDLNYGSGSIFVVGTGFALDAGVPQGNNSPVKVWKSYPCSPQQTWYLTNDNRIAITGGNQCLDQGDNGPQTYQCTPGNTNQEGDGTVLSGPGHDTACVGQDTATSTSAPATSSSASVYGKQIIWRHDVSQCLTVDSPPADGASVSLQTCEFRPSMDLYARQTFQYTSTGGIRLGGTNYCLDAQSSPSNGGQLQIWTCYGSPQQTFKDAGNGLIQTSNNQCLDLDNSNKVHMQTWECSNPDLYQQFSFF